MIRFKDISIPKPCSVDYDSLPGDEIKRFCGSCEKHVYDFRDKDEAYLNEVFRTTGKVCGVYYEDQIQKPSLKIQRPFYYAFVTRVLTIGLFLKATISTYTSKAENFRQQTISQLFDSTTVKTVFTGSKNNADYYYINISIFIDHQFFKSYLMLNEENIYLPDTIRPEQKIKIIASTTRYSFDEFDKKTFRKKKYHFSFKNSNQALVKINYNKKIVFIRTRRNTVTGMPCPPNFW